MTGEERREEILNTIAEAVKPVSGTALAEKYHVSRQVIVQDIALLRAAHQPIVATNRGYLMKKDEAAQRVISVYHEDDQIEDELNTIVDLGGIVKDVFITHAVYGQLSAKLDVRSRRNVQEFLEKISSGEAQPLKNLTCGFHSHTVEAGSEEELDLIEEELRRKGYVRKQNNTMSV